MADDRTAKALGLTVPPSLIARADEEGIAKAKAEKLYKGRQKTAQQNEDTILKLHGEGKGAATILKQIRDGKDKKVKPHRIGQSSSTRSSQITGNRPKEWRPEKPLSELSWVEGQNFVFDWYRRSVAWIKFGTRPRTGIAASGCTGRRSL
jgi:hypothetical protein